MFTYSFEPDTPAAKLPDHLPEEVKNERRERLMAVQQEVAFDWNDAQIGRQLDVLIDAAVPGEKNAWIGRSYADAPDVDGVVYVTGEGLAAGAIVPCEIVGQQRVRSGGRRGRRAALDCSSSVESTCRTTSGSMEDATCPMDQAASPRKPHARRLERPQPAHDRAAGACRSSVSCSWRSTGI